MAQRLVQDYLSREGASASLDPSLTPREKEVLRLVAEGYSNKEIAEKLVISLSTVHSHRSKVMRKLGLSTCFELVQYARQRGLIQDV
jgi:two-component system response regulator NreC